MADQDKERTGQAFVAGPKGRKPTRAEAEAMAGALFDAINRKRKKGKKGKKAQG